MEPGVQQEQLTNETYWWNWGPEKGRRETRERRSNWRTKEICDAGNGKGIFFIWRDTVSFWGTRLEHRMVHEACSSHSQWDPVLPFQIWREKKATTQKLLEHFSKKIERIESSKESDLCHQTSGMSETAAYPLSPVADDFQLYHLPPPLLQPVSYLACSLAHSPCMSAVVL